MKKKFLHGAAALALCAGFVGCSEYDAGLVDSATGLTAEQMATVQEYVDNFTARYGQIDPNHTWGFGDALETRAVFTDKWPNAKQPEHSCNWANMLNIPTESEVQAIDGVVNVQNYCHDGWYDSAAGQGDVYYIPNGFTLTYNNFPVKLKEGDVVYNFGTINFLDANIDGNGVVTFYNAETGTMTYGMRSGGEHTIVNKGTLYIADYSKIGHLYNASSLILEHAHNPYDDRGGTADVYDDIHIYSTEDGIVYMPDGGDLKAVCDIHGTLDVRDTKDENAVRNVKIQNKTTKYICSIIATGLVNNVDGPLITSCIKADEILFDGNPIYLTEGGYLKAETTITIPNSGCNVYGHTGENVYALVETTNFAFGNKNDLTHTFSNNIYFKVGGHIDMQGPDKYGSSLGNCYEKGGPHFFKTVDDYLNFTDHNDEYGLTRDRVNQDLAARGVNINYEPNCGGTPTPGDEKKYINKRIMCEDLGTTYDFDFNDIVFDVISFEKKNGVWYANIVVQAAGGTLPVYIGSPDAKYEVHYLLTGGTATNIALNVGDTQIYPSKPCSIALDIRENRTPVLNDIKLYGKGTLLSQENQLAEICRNDYSGDAKVPLKICVPTSVWWTRESQQIDKAYSGFRTWVGDENARFEEGAWYLTDGNKDLLVTPLK